MTSKVIYLGDLRTEATHIQSGQKIITDAPVDNEGKGEAFSPTDLAATSLASCMITIMSIAAKKRNINMTGTSANIVKVMSPDPRRISEIQINIKFPDHLNDKEQTILQRAGETCPVSYSLSSGLKQTTIYS